MKTIVAYGFRFEDETLKQAAMEYLNGSLAFKTKKEALTHLKKIRYDKSNKKDKKAKIFKFIAEE